jgi:VWFA-related protein
MTLARVLLAGLLALPAIADKPASEVLTIDFVEVPVNVVDRAGNPVRNLARENFEVYVDRKKIDLSSMETIDFSSPESRSRLAANPAAHRSFLLVFDLGYSGPRSLQRAQDAAKSFVEKSVQRGDLVGVATLDDKRGYKIVSNFTSDRGASLAAVSNPKQFRAFDPLQLSAQMGFDKAQIEEDLAYATGKEAELLQQEADQANFEETSRQNMERQRVLREIDLLSQLAASLRNIRGHKEIVLLSEGFDPRLIQGRTAKDLNQENEAAKMITEGTWYMDGKMLDMDRRYGSNTELNSLQILQQAFTGADVTLNAVDILGVRGQVATSRGELVASNDGLFLLANPTGGTLFENSNDLTNDFARMLHQQEFVYVLGFQTTVRNPGKLHGLKVKVTGLPAGSRILSRQGYFEGGTRYTPVERSLNTADVIVRDIPQDAVHIASMAVPFPGAVAGDKAAVPVVLEIRGSDLLKNAVGNDIAAEVFVYAFDEQGAVRDRIYDRLALDVSVGGDRLRANGVKYIASLSLSPGKYAIKSVVRIAGSDKLGYTRSDVEVPQPGEMSLLPPFVLDDPKVWVMVSGGKSGAVYPFQVNGEPFVPSITGKVDSEHVRKIAVFVENAQPEELTWETTPEATLLAQVKGSDATKLVLQLDPDTTQPSRFGVTVHRAGVVMRASVPLTNR